MQLYIIIQLSLAKDDDEMKNKPSCVLTIPPNNTSHNGITNFPVRLENPLGFPLNLEKPENNHRHLICNDPYRNMSIKSMARGLNLDRMEKCNSWEEVSQLA